VVRSSYRSAASVLLACAIATTALLDIQSWAAAMACCAMADYECATVGGPDECCQSGGHAVASATAAPPPSSVSLPALMFAVISAIPVPPLEPFERLLASAAFKRPHDPPHLHPVPLLV
jgi:hypothetical protein